MNPRRTPMIVVTVLVLAAVACSLTEFTRGEEAGGTAPGTAAPEASEPPAPVEPGAPGEVTPTPRRLTLQPTPTPFHVTSEDDPRSILDLARPDHFDYFDVPENWYDYDSEGFAAYGVEDGELWGIDRQPEENFVYWSYASVMGGNLYAEVSATNGDCIGRDSVGMNIRLDAEHTPSGYSLEVSCDGAWRFRRHDPQRIVEDLVEWTPDEAIQTGAFAVNRLGLYAYQDQFALFVNGVMVGEATDPDLMWTLGYYALYVRASQTFDLTATFDNFAYWDIPFQP